MKTKKRIASVVVKPVVMPISHFWCMGAGIENAIECDKKTQNKKCHLWNSRKKSCVFLVETFDLA